MLRSGVQVFLHEQHRDFYTDSDLNHINPRTSRFKDLPQNQEPWTTAPGNSVNTNNPKRLNIAGGLRAGNPLPPTPGSSCDLPSLPPRAGGPRCGGRGRPFVQRGLGVGHRRCEDKAGPGQAWGASASRCQARRCFPSPGGATAGCGVTRGGGLRAGAAIPGMGCYLGRRVLGRGRGADGRGFQCSPPSSPRPGRASAASAVCSRWPLLIIRQQPLSPPAICFGETDLCSLPEYIAN